MRLLAMVLVLALAACSSSREESDAGGWSVADVVGDWSTDLRAQNASGISGEVKLQSAVAGSGVTVSVSGAPAGAQLPWHIHRGTCASGGPILGEASAYPLLAVGEDGRARLATTIGSPLNERERYHVNVHRSMTEMNVIVACGDLKN
jgi:hypothetical protein